MIRENFYQKWMAHRGWLQQGIKIPNFTALAQRLPCFSVVPHYDCYSVAIRIKNKPAWDKKYLNRSYSYFSYHSNTLALGSFSNNSYFGATLTLLYFVKRLDIRSERYIWKLHESLTQKVNVNMCTVCTMYTWSSDMCV